MLSILTKFSTPVEVGKFAYGLAVTAPIILFANLQLRAVQATDVRGEFRLREYVSLRLWTTLAALLVIVAFAVSPIASLGTASLVAVFGVAKSLESMSDVFHGYLQQKDRMVIISRSIIFKGLLSLTLVAVATFVFRSAIAAASAFAVASMVVLAFYDRPVMRRLAAADPSVCSNNEPVQMSRLRQLALVALPLGVVQGLVSLGANIPRYQLEHTAGLGDVGIYSALATLIVVGQTAISALGNVASPRLARMHAKGDLSGFVRMLTLITAPGIALGTAGILVCRVWGEQLLTVLFRPEYAAHADVLMMIMIGATFAYTAWLLGFGMTAARIFREQIPLLATVCVAAWLAAFVFVGQYGMMGAAIAFTVSMATQCAGALAILRLRLRHPLERSL